MVYHDMFTIVDVQNKKSLSGSVSSDREMLIMVDVLTFVCLPLSILFRVVREIPDLFESSDCDICSSFLLSRTLLSIFSPPF